MYVFNRRQIFLWVRQNLGPVRPNGIRLAAPTISAGARSRFSTKEGEYHGLRSKETFERQEWTKQAEILDEERLDIDGHPVMQAWEAPYMAELARIATSQGGRVLEVGFGMAISATAVQQYKIDEHIIMEANADVYKRLEAFAVKYPKTTPMGPALWQDSISKIPDASIDGILYDTYPLNKEEQHVHQFEFLKQARRILKPGGVLTYCNLTSLGVLKNDYDSWVTLFQETQLPHLLAAGFTADEIKPIQIVPVTPTATCEYYTHSTALAPVIRRSGVRGFSSMGGARGGLQRFTRGFASSPPPPPPPSAAQRPAGSIREMYDTDEEYQVSGMQIDANMIQEVNEQQHRKQTIPLEQIYPREGLRPEDLAKSNLKIKVNAWTQWGDLDTILVGHANHACFPPSTPGFRPEINDPNIAAWMDWPEGRKKDSVVERANIELDNLSHVLEEHGINVVRPGNLDWYGSLKTPFFEVPNQYTHTCVRDSLITMGPIVLEAAMSRRDRYFEAMAFRSIVRHLWENDSDMLWKSAPKPMLGDDSFNDNWWTQSDDERYNKMHDYKFCITEKDILFDAADIMRAGKDIFVQLSMTCNKSGIEWLRRELKPHGIRVHTVRFPYDLAPSHLDCTFQLLAPGLVLTNPERPIADEDAAIFKDNGWKFVNAPQPNNPQIPAFSQSSKWLSMNILPLGHNKIVVEEQEINTQGLLRSLGFEVIAVPFRNVYEFGGSLHCATWDISRTDSCDDFFPIQ